MNVDTYPGKGLSLSQLVFALSEELKRTAYSPSFTPADISQLGRDVSTALASIREWGNSFIHINRIPLDVLSLIPAHLHSQTDRFNASHVCRHWRRTFLQHAALWSRLFLSKGEIYMKTLLERARGSPLDVFANCHAPVGTITLLSSHTRQIRSLELIRYWTDIQIFSDVSSGPLPLLRTLEINVIEDSGSADQPNTMTPPSPPLFSNAVNLEKFVLCSEKPLFLNHFVLPNLTTFKLSIEPGWDRFKALDLLNFLEASPMLRTVEMNITARILLEGVAQRGIVVLPNVQTFSLVMDDGEPGYKLVAHISCPSASHTSFTHQKTIEDIPTNQDVRYGFPAASSWDTIVRQYSTSSVEAISLEIDTFLMLSCTLTFRSSNATTIELCLLVSGDADDPHLSLDEVVQGAFSQACRAVRDYPLLHNAKHLHIRHRASLSDPDSDEVIDMAIMELAESRHEIGRPFERMTVRAERLLSGIRELLERWVSVVECYESGMST